MAAKSKTVKIEYGSEEHKALLGLSSAGMMTPEQKAAAEEQLKTKPIPISARQPVIKENYEPATATQPGDEVFDGWVYLEG